MRLSAKEINVALDLVVARVINVWMASVSMETKVLIAKITPLPATSVRKTMPVPGTLLGAPACQSINATHKLAIV